jgi:hypothetical protein
MSIRRRWVRISNWSREVLFTCGERKNVEALDARRQRHRAAHNGARALGRIHDLKSRLINQSIVERLEADADFLVLHVSFLKSERAHPDAPAGLYSIILATTPAPTVRPPSRMAKRRPSSMAIGAISFTVIVMLSPGITISVPAGSSIEPVTSVVRK